LDISGCGLTEWSQIAAFGELPTLQELLLDNNIGLVTVVPPEADGQLQNVSRFSLSSTGYVQL
jgi:hypothetical protein